MPSGRLRTPTEILEARGSFKSHPDRRRKRQAEPVVYEPLGDAPDNFTDEQRKAWEDFRTHAPAGVLTHADNTAVELASVLLAKFREKTQEGKSVSGPELSKLVVLLGQFGMTPADRSRVQAVGIKKPENPFGQVTSRKAS